MSKSTSARAEASSSSSPSLEAVTLKVPRSWLDVADSLSKSGVLPNEVTRIEMLRVALGYGLEALMKENTKRQAREARRSDRVAGLKK
jgi:hypothetical protein